MKTKPTFFVAKSWVVIVLMLIAFAFFFSVLIKIQLVDADFYTSMVQGYTVVWQPVRAERGEILDRNGVPLVQNMVKYNAIIDRTFLPKDKDEQNRIFLDLIALFESLNVEWTDNFPISKTEPFKYIDGMQSEAETLKSVKNAQSYTTADDMIYWLIEEYGLEKYSKTDARNLIAIRYQMERKDFSNSTPYIFAENLPTEMVVTIEEHSYELSGVSVVSSSDRYYTDESFALHILGSIGPIYKEEYELLKEEDLLEYSSTGIYQPKGYSFDDVIGKDGIERSLEDSLRGKNGLREIHLDENGKVVLVKDVEKTESGNTILMTLDTNMQRIASEALETQIKHLNETQPKDKGGKAFAGSVVVLSPKTGEVLAAATFPTYTVSEYKNNFAKVAGRSGSPLINRAFMGQYTPGSTYKPVVAITGLNNKTITPTSTFNCTGTYHFFAPAYSPKCLGTHGHIDVDHALAWSCNIFFYDTGRLTGIDNIDKTAKALGLGEPTGIEIAEASGQRSNPESKAARGGGEWYPADTIQTAIGQFDNKFTPIQLANYAATIANRGKRMKLTLVKEVKDYSETKTITPFTPQVTEDSTTFISNEAFETTINGMVSATIGTASGTFAGYPIKVASKTGTPQVSNTAVNSTFIAFAPADDPEIVVAVVIEEGWHGYTGAPVAKAVFDDYFKVDHRGSVPSGPQRLEDMREERLKEGIETPEGVRDIDILFPQYINGMDQPERELNKEIALS